MRHQGPTFRVLDIQSRASKTKLKFHQVGINAYGSDFSITLLFLYRDISFHVLIPAVTVGRMFNVLLLCSIVYREKHSRFQSISFVLDRLTSADMDLSLTENGNRQDVCNLLLHDVRHLCISICI
jgi:hypothetical protein